MSGVSTEKQNAKPNAARVVSRSFTIVNQRGLHARASAKFVQTVDAHDADVAVEKDGITVGGTSIMGLMMLAASPGCSILVRAEGPQAEAVLDALGALIAARFGEEV
ncbi:HPr family phosphocarrier protein [Nitratireductor pacificus]|uniref:HPr family phosphocarrier protein n=1 Tax=Nitratireductor pacificus pht-3B TaxID=391937 RepID=K2MA11_9HYPH|nr:HPr family phosphocarrier protein [Nitratireductor pacificus]EKF18991.1 HPr family phosphocarrier protein [Nitratireductor pacificus pht-3B]